MIKPSAKSLNSSRSRTNGNYRAFTVLEVLVAMAVFSILLLGLLSVTLGTTNLTNLTRRNIDASSKLRSTMDRLTIDIQNAVRAPESAFFLSSDGTNRELHFLSHVDGYGGQRPLAVVRYRIRSVDNFRGTGKPSLVMERAAEGVGLDDPSIPGATTGDYDQLADGVFRFHLEFLDRDGRPVAPDTDGVLPAGEIGAVIVNLAAMDDRALAVAADADWTASMPGSDFAQWASQIESLDFTGLPEEAARGIQIRRKLILLH